MFVVHSSLIGSHLGSDDVKHGALWSTVHLWFHLKVHVSVSLKDSDAADWAAAAVAAAATCWLMSFN